MLRSFRKQERHQKAGQPPACLSLSYFGKLFVVLLLALLPTCIYSTSSHKSTHAMPGAVSCTITFGMCALSLAVQVLTSNGHRFCPHLLARELHHNSLVFAA